MVIENHPVLEDGSPFPTLFWLTCPILAKRASGLESSGFMAHVTQLANDHPGFRHRLVAAIARYRDRRDSHAVIAESGSAPGGGPERVKCLHAHLADQLAGGANPVGAITLAASEWPDCIEPCVVVKG